MDNRVTLVTGGAAGIGLAVARELRRYGPVIVADVDAQRLADAQAEGLHPYHLDVRSTDEWVRLAEFLRREYGRLDHLIHNAGIAPIAPLTEATDEQFDATYETNVRAILVGTRELWSLLVDSQASVVTIASAAALVGQNNSAGYVASKGAVVALTRALAVELAPHRVRVNSICPGTTDTPMLRAHFASLPDPEETRNHLIARHPIGRLLTPEDVAPTVVHLAVAELSGGTTGSNVVVDGGLTATFDYGTSFAGGAQ